MDHKLELAPVPMCDQGKLSQGIEFIERPRGTFISQTIIQIAVKFAR